MDDATMERATEMAGQAKQRAQATAASAADQARDVAGTAKEQAGEVVSEATSQVRNLAGDARDQLRQQADTQLQSLGGSLDQISERLRTMAEADGGGDDLASQLVRQAADLTGQTASRLQQGQAQDLLDQVQSFARRRPGLFLLGALGAGMAVGRLVRNVDTKAVAQAATGDRAPAGGGQDQLRSPTNPFPGELPTATGPTAPALVDERV